MTETTSFMEFDAIDEIVMDDPMTKHSMRYFSQLFDECCANHEAICGDYSDANMAEREYDYGYSLNFVDPDHWCTVGINYFSNIDDDPIGYIAMLEMRKYHHDHGFYLRKESVGYGPFDSETVIMKAQRAWRTHNENGWGIKFEYLTPTSKTSIYLGA